MSNVVPPPPSWNGSSPEQKRSITVPAIVVGIVLGLAVVAWMFGTFLTLLSVTPEDAPNIWLAMVGSLVLGIAGLAAFAGGVWKKHLWLFALAGLLFVIGPTWLWVAIMSY